MAIAMYIQLQNIVHSILHTVSFVVIAAVVVWMIVLTTMIHRS